MKNKYFEKLKEFHDKLNVPGFMCYYECFMGDFDGDHYCPLKSINNSLKHA